MEMLNIWCCFFFSSIRVMSSFFLFSISLSLFFFGGEGGEGVLLP